MINLNVIQPYKVFYNKAVAETFRANLNLNCALSVLKQGYGVSTEPNDLRLAVGEKSDKHGHRPQQHG